MVSQVAPIWQHKMVWENKEIGLIIVKSLPHMCPCANITINKDEDDWLLDMPSLEGHKWGLITYTR